MQDSQGGRPCPSSRLHSRIRSRSRDNHRGQRQDGHRYRSPACPYVCRSRLRSRDCDRRHKRDHSLDCRERNPCHRTRSPRRSDYDRDQERRSRSEYDRRYHNRWEPDYPYAKRHRQSPSRPASRLSPCDYRPHSPNYRKRCREVDGYSNNRLPYREHNYSKSILY